MWERITVALAELGPAALAVSEEQRDGSPPSRRSLLSQRRRRIWCSTRGCSSLSRPRSDEGLRRSALTLPHNRFQAQLLLASMVPFRQVSKQSSFRVSRDVRPIPSVVDFCRIDNVLTGGIS